VTAFLEGDEEPNERGVMNMVSTALLNLIMSIVGIGILATVMRVAHMAAGGRFDNVPAPQLDVPSDLERAT
jgi:hypothetical protein